MAIRKSNDIANEGSTFGNQKTTSKLDNINERFDDTTHNDNPYDDAIQYIKKKVDEIVDETNTQTIASGSYNSSIATLKTASGSFSTRVTAEEAKNSPSVKTVDIAMSVDESNNLVISSGKGRDIVTWTIAADEG